LPAERQWERRWRERRERRDFSNLVERRKEASAGVYSNAQAPSKWQASEISFWVRARLRRRRRRAYSWEKSLWTAERVRRGMPSKPVR